MTVEQQKIARNDLWFALYNKWYECYFNEDLARRMVKKWQLFNDPAKVLMAITTSGSVIAGWTLWNEPVYKTFWIILAGLGALASVFTTTLTISDRIQDWTKSKSEFSGIRIDAEILKLKMKLDPEFDVQQAQDALNNIALRHNDAVSRIPNDLLHTKRLENLCKTELDALIISRNLWS